MKQLTKHIMHVYFFTDKDWDVPAQIAKVDCADIDRSRVLGREIGGGMARGVGDRVESITREIERK